jgi:hypothetical protein
MDAVTTEETPAPAPQSQADAVEMDTTPDAPAEETWEDIPEDVLASTTEDIMTRVRLIENDIKVMRSETLRLQHEQSTMKEKIRDNGEKVKQNKVLPYLVGNVVEVRISAPLRELGVDFLYLSCWMLILKGRTMGLTRILILCVAANVPSSKPPHAKLFSSLL